MRFFALGLAPALVALVGAEVLAAQPSNRQSFQVVLTDLDGNDLAKRKQAALAAGIFWHESDLPISGLVRALRADDPLVRAEAARALSHFGPRAKPAVPDLLAAVRSPDWTLRAAAAYALGTIQAPSGEAIEALQRSSADRRPQVRLSAAYALGSLGSGDAEAVRAVFALLGDVDDSVRIAAMGSLRHLLEGPNVSWPEGTRDAAKRLAGEKAKAWLKDPSPELRGAGLQALAAFAGVDDEAVALARQGLRDAERPAVSGVSVLRLAAVHELTLSSGTMTSKAAGLTGELIGALDSPFEGARHGAAFALGEVGPLMKAQPADVLGTRVLADLIAALSKALSDKAFSVRQNAASSLAQLGPSAMAALPSLVERLKSDPEEHMRRLAAKAIGEIGPAARPMAEKPLLEALADRGPHKWVPPAAAGALVRLGVRTPEVVEALVAALKGRVELEAALLSLGMLDYSQLDRAVPALIPALSDNDGYARALAAWVLTKAGDASLPALAALTQAVDDESADVRVYAVQALGQLGESAARAAPRLALRLRDQDERVRFAAAWALRMIGPAAGKAVPALRAALSSGDPRLRVRAAAALACIAPPQKDVRKLLDAASRSSDLDAGMWAKDGLWCISSRWRKGP